LKPHIAKEKTMHDLDRTQSMFESYNTGEFEFGDDAGDFEFESEGEGVFDEVQEMELAAELLEISDEGELDQFLGNLMKKAGAAARKVVKSPLGKQLGGILKGAAKSALPMVGSALGNMVAPGIGGAFGGKAASALGSAFGLELEGLSPQDQEFEVARKFVRFAGEATKNAASSPSASPQAVKNAVLEAAQKHAPGLVRAASARAGAGGLLSPEAGYQGNGNGDSGQSGRWVRKGKRIILLGV
jgi:hypothetical protein